MPTHSPWITVAVIGGAVLVVLGGVWSAISVNRRPRGFAGASGVVVDSILEWGPTNEVDRATTRMHRPVVAFRDAGGREITFRSKLSATSMPRPGQTVMVLYNPADPTDARIAPQSLPGSVRFALPVALVVVAVIATVILLKVF